jgi:hypothetical protein
MSSTDGAGAGVRSSREWLVAAVVVFLGAGCDESLGPFVPSDWGLITLDHVAANGTDYTRPQALFYSSVSSPNLSGRGVADTCGTFSYPSPPGDAAVDEISAGESVTLDLQGTQYSLVPTQIGNRRPYTVPEPGIAYRPGDSVTAHVPGSSDGFPQMSIRGRTAEPLTLGPVDTVASGPTFMVTWSPSGDDSSRVVVSLQYHDDLNPGSGLNTQVFCTFLDDGAGTIPLLPARSWASANGTRRVQAVRWRSVLESKDDARLYLVSTYTVTKTSFP